MNPSFKRQSTSPGYGPPTYAMAPKLIDYDCLMLFVEEMIDYSLRQNDLSNWVPPMNLEYLRLKHPDKRYFDDRIGEAIAHPCMERNALDSARRHGFDEQLWLNLNPDEARERLIGNLGLMLNQAVLSAVDFTALQVFSFGCYVARSAVKKGLNSMVNTVIHALVHTCCVHFPYEKEYTEFLTKAETYSLGHYCMHF